MAYQVKGSYSRASEEVTELFKLYKVEVISWLYPKTKELILDYLAIKNSSLVVNNLSDYSYLVTPIFKALEGSLLQIGEDLGFDFEKYSFKIGVVFSEENLENFYNDVLGKIEELSSEHKSDIQMWLNDARRILRHYRHSPAHYSGETKNSYEEAFSSGDHIFRIINEMCFSLLDSGIFKTIKK